MKPRLADVAFGLALVAAGFCWAQFWQRPALKKAEGIRTELQLTREAIGWGNDFTRDLDELERLMHQFEQDLVDLDRLAPKQIDSSLRVSEIAAVAAATGVEAKSIRPDVAQPRGVVTVYPVTVVLAGRYPELVRFLHGAESLPRHTRVTRLEVTEDPLDKGKVTAEVELTAYSVISAEGA